METFVILFLAIPLLAAPGIISASPYGGAHAFPPAFAIQQTGQSTNMVSHCYSIYNETRSSLEVSMWM